MAWLVAVVVAICALRTSATVGGSDYAETLLQQRPDLGVYQDLTECLHRGAKWRVLYRNKDQGEFGTDDDCLAETQLTDLVDGEARFRFRYGPGHERNATYFFRSSKGQSHKNIFLGLLDGAPHAVPYDQLFVDCAHCRVQKRRGDSKCVLFVPESSLRRGVPQHCHFVFDLLCGSSPKYPVSDASCLGANPGVART
ncbi:uncharacterized protein LOC144097832 [Amblyomma americanum]